MEILEPNIELIPSDCGTASNGHGCFYGSSLGMNYISGPPIILHRFGLEVDKPKWIAVDPRFVEFKVRSFFKERRNTKDELQNPVNDIFLKDQICHLKRKYRDLNFLKIIDKELLRIAAKVPLSAKPFLQIWLSQRIPEYFQLLRTNPMLAIILSLDHIQTRNIPIDDYVISIKESCTMKRREMLEDHGFLGKSLTGFKKISYSAADPKLLLSLKWSLKDENINKTFVHMPKITLSTIHFFTNKRLFNMVSNAFLFDAENTADCNTRSQYYSMLNKVIDIESVLKIKSPSKFNSVSALRSKYFEYIDFVGESNISNIANMVFPLAPFAYETEKDFIEGVRTGNELAQLGYKYRNCLLSYYQKLRMGYCFIFKVNKKYGLDNAVFEVSHKESSRKSSYILSEIQGFANTPISSRTYAAVKIWLEDRGVIVPDNDIKNKPEQTLFAFM